MILYCETFFKIYIRGNGSASCFSSNGLQLTARLSLFTLSLTLGWGLRIYKNTRVFPKWTIKVPNNVFYYWAIRGGRLRDSEVGLLGLDSAALAKTWDRQAEGSQPVAGMGSGMRYPNLCSSNYKGGDRQRPQVAEEISVPNKGTVCDAAKYSLVRLRCG